MAKTKQIKNFTLNFGPQHPAAHGVFRSAPCIDLHLSTAGLQTSAGLSS